MKAAVAGEAAVRTETVNVGVEGNRIAAISLNGNDYAGDGILIF